MKNVTLCLLIKDNQLLLAMKKRGFGAGKWNGPGGKVAPGEEINAAAAREVLEEIKVVIREENLQPIGDLKFYFVDEPKFDQHMFLFKVTEWEGEPEESEEMKPEWFNFDELPLSEMWISDKEWLPKVLKEGKVYGEIKFKNGGAEVLESSLFFNQPENESSMGKG